MPALLPPFDEPVTSFAELLERARERLAKARQLDRHAGFPPPLCELQGRFQTNWLRATVLLLVVTLVMPFFSAAAALVSGALLFAGIVGLHFMFRSTAREVTKRRRNGLLLPAALIMANDQLFEPGWASRYGVVVYSLDEKLRDDRFGLLELASRVQGLRGSRDHGSPQLDRIARDLDREWVLERSWSIPAGWAGAERTWGTDLMFDRERLPSGYIDLSVFLCVVDPEARVAPAELLPLDLWYRPDVLPFLRDETSKQTAPGGES